MNRSYNDIVFFAFFFPTTKMKKWYSYQGPQRHLGIIPIIGVYRLVYTYNWYYTEGILRSLIMEPQVKKILWIIIFFLSGCVWKNEKYSVTSRIVMVLYKIRESFFYSSDAMKRFRDLKKKKQYIVGYYNYIQ